MPPELLAVTALTADLTDEERGRLFMGMTVDAVARWMAQWSSSYISSLPDSSFLYIEKHSGVTKDDDGKTLPRGARHFPVKDADGKVDLPHVRNALSRVEQWKTLSNGDDVPAGTVDSVRSKAQKLLDAATKSMAEELETVTLARVAVLSSGGPYHGAGSPPEGDFYSKADLDEIVAANHALAAEVRPPNKIGHSREQKLLANSGISLDEQPAAGWLDPASMTVEQADDGKWKIFTDIVKVPAKLAKLFQAGAWRTRSVELSRIRSQGDDGETVYENVISGLAWLGAKAPAVRTLEDVFALYGQTTDEARIVTLLEQDETDEEPQFVRTVEYLDAVQATIIWQPEAGFQDVLSDLRAALNPTSSSRYWVQDVSVDLTAAIVSDWDSNVTWIVPFEMNDAGDPVPAPASDWTEAEQAWVAAGDEYADRNFGEGVRIRAKAAYTDAVTDTRKLPKTTDEQIAALAKTFSVEGEGDALRDAVAAKLEELGIVLAAEKADEPAPAPAAEPATTMSAADVETLKTDAEMGRKAYEDRRVEKREELLRTHLNKIEPAQVETWRAFYDAQPELAKTQLEALPELPKLRTYGSDEQGLPAGVTPEDAGKAGEDFYASYAATYGVTRVSNG